MKKIVLLMGLLLCMVSIQAQIENTSEEKYQLPSNKEVRLHLKFAHLITVKVWDQSSLIIKTKIKSSSEELRKLHLQEVKEENATLFIETTYDLSEEKWGKGECWNCEMPPNTDKECKCLEVSYEVFVPRTANLSIETISGNIEILDAMATLHAKTISGFVDLSLPPETPSDLTFKSVMGEIYTDFNIELDKSSNAYSKKVNASINGGGAPLKLESVSGDIFLRQM